MSAGNTFFPGAICFDWTASFGVLCLGVAEVTWAEGSSYSSGGGNHLGYAIWSRAVRCN